MNRREDSNRESGVVTPLGEPAPSTELLYVIELWDLSRTTPERTIGRAASAVLARAIFTAAQNEHLGRRIVLRRGGKVIAESD
ncbi:hypothetical protein [Phenylobacterium sp.]|uniref:hypothetical protein n=1 Tax=Phenylobacterium sp. TaxID=1871053 RepID=UPI002811C1DE|nr:hypothetical protein [Phenylobacterium sp.]